MKIQTVIHNVELNIYIMNSQKQVVVYKRSHARRRYVGKNKPQDVNEIYRNWKNDFLRQYPWLLNVTDDYIDDKFNIYGLKEEFSFFDLCCDIICKKANLSTVPQKDLEEIREQLPQVYGMIHARFILSPAGLKALKDKYVDKQYGTCPRLNCKNASLLPIGLSSQMKDHHVKAFCPCCREIFHPRPKIDLDGAYFGPNAAHIFLDEMNLTSIYKNFQPYAHNAFGFRLRSYLFEVPKEEEEE